MGLCPKEGAELKDGYYNPSEFQLWLYEAWQYFWNTWVPKFTGRKKFNIIFNGDGLEGLEHDFAKITPRWDEQLDLAERVLLPKLDRAENLYWIAGTRAHVGKSSQYEQVLAKICGAEPEGSSYARWEIWLRVGDALGHVLHTIGSTLNEHTAVSNEIADAQREAGRWGTEAPRFIVRSHVHRHAHAILSSEHGMTHSITTPGWQGKTPFCHRIRQARNKTPHVGGIGIKWEKGDLVIDSWFRKVNPPKVLNL